MNKIDCNINIAGTNVLAQSKLGMCSSKSDHGLESTNSYWARDLALIRDGSFLPDDSVELGSIIGELAIDLRSFLGLDVRNVSFEEVSGDYVSSLISSGLLHVLLKHGGAFLVIFVFGDFCLNNIVIIVKVELW